MNVLEIIDKKRKREVLTGKEIRDFFMGYMNGQVADYQMSSMLMAIVLNGMTFEETLYLTDVMLNSGKVMDTKKVKGIMVDKHSTGGVGDKTSLIIGPILSSLGLKMGKLSGRGLGNTGGTIDKLESIPGFRVALTSDEFIHNLNKVGFVECEQTPEFTPLDKKIYELRSVTGTVSSVPLIASSIMSKKLAVGANYILIDLKVGKGALLQTKSDAMELASMLVRIGAAYKKQVIPVLSNMDRPLGDNVGNGLEVIEAMDVLKGKNGVLRDLCIELASNLYSKAYDKSMDESIKEVTRVLDDGSAYNKFMEFVKKQGGDIDKLTLAANIKPVVSSSSGTLKDIDASIIAKTVTELGGGRKRIGDRIDYSVGVVINKHLGDSIDVGDTLCYIYQNDEIDRTNEVIGAFSIVK